ncbi:MAG: isoprenoid biosynthesis glyoxalase ElbB [Spirochaetes bacterium]|nr:isoprenoid biosynthesis glyoxalase ElbB [Spirochaetota bacterium]
MFKRNLITGITALCIFALFAISTASAKAEKKVGIILSGCGMMDGTEVYEAAFTVLALEKAGAKVVFMAPDINQASVVNHLKNDAKAEGTRNALVESARIARGDIKNIKDVKASDLDALILIGGIGSITTLSNFMAKGDKGTVEPDVEYLIKAVNASGKPIGSMCAASMIIAKVFGDKNVKITIGPKNDYFGPAIKTFGAQQVIAKAADMVVDKENRIVTTPAVMSGESNANIYLGITKMVNQVVKMSK